jgi:hypothetical protein
VHSVTRIIITVVGLLASVHLAADQVINDNQIVQGSLCVGQDCVNGEVFDADVVRLKENNLRIRFHDTTIVGDAFGQRLGQSWNISANDSQNSGDTYVNFEVKSLFVEASPLSDGTAALYDCSVLADCDQTSIPYVCPIVGTIPVGKPVTDSFCQPLPPPDLPAPVSDGTASLYDCSVLADCDQTSFPYVCPIVGTMPVGEPVTDSYCQPLPPPPRPFTVKSMLKLVADNTNTDMVIEDGVTIGYESDLVDGAVSVGRADIARRIANVAAGMEDTNILITQVLSDYDPFEQQVAAVDDLNQQLDTIDVQLDDIEVIIAALENPATDSDDVISNTGSGSSNCFIATAAYGSYLEPEVQLLRSFRDRYLLSNAPGRAFVEFYYQTSPPIADVISEHRALRVIARVALTPMVYAIKHPAAAGLAFLLMISAPVGQMRQRKAA